MTTYRLPDALGGGEYEEYRHVNGGTEAPAGTVAFLEAGCIFTVARRLLTEVKPPPPPEPPVGSIVHLASYYGVYERVDRGWLLTSDAAGRACDCTLLRLNSGDAPVRLVPDPFAGLFDLPWESAPRLLVSRVSRSTVEVRDSGRIRDFNEAGDGKYLATVDWTPDGARAKARALWAAADAVEAKR